MNSAGGNKTRSKVLNCLAGRIHAMSRPHTIRVAIDGIDGAGKTTLADELTPLLQNRDRPVIRASIDGFHHPRAVRYQRGTDSPEGYYSDSFDNRALIAMLLEPLGPGGNELFQAAIFDLVTDTVVNSPIRRAPPGAVLLFDGVFLLRPELRDYWDFALFVDVPFDVALIRAVGRDQHKEDREQLVRRYRQRYLPGQRLYLGRCHPRQQADVILNNRDLARPLIIER